MKDADKISTLDLQHALPGYSGKFGYPTFRDIQQYLPDYFHYSDGWETWDLPNKSTVILRWHDKQVDAAQQALWLEEDSAAQARLAAEEKIKRENEELQRLDRLAKQEIEAARRKQGASVVALQVECSARKQVDRLIDEANELVSCAGKLVATLRRIPVERRSEIDIDSFLFNAGRVVKIGDKISPAPA